METLHRSIKTEQLAYWFFRLNGCLNLTNFLIHDQPGREGTDVDVLAVRFPHRHELIMSGNPMKDHSVFDLGGKIDLVIAEVKLGQCNLNGPWTKPVRQNMHRVLYAVGAYPEDQVKIIAIELYQNQYYEDDGIRCRLFALGRNKSVDLNPNVVQLRWSDILGFIHRRFIKYEKYKTQHCQWDETGEYLFRTATQFRQDKDAFVQLVLSRLTA